MEPLVDLMSRLLGRTLSGQEKEVLEFLSPQGVAKLNADISKGSNLEYTMIDLVEVFQALQRRRTRMESWLTPAAQSILSRLNRPPTTDELAMLADVPATVLMAKLMEQLKEGGTIEDVLEELAIGHRQKLLMCDAQRTATELGKPVSISRLVPTAAPTATAKKALGTTLSMVSAPVLLPLVPPQNDMSLGLGEAIFDGLAATPSRRPQSIRLGLSPIVTWFADSPRTMSEISFDVDTVARSPRSCSNSPEASFRDSAGGRRESLPVTSSPKSSDSLLRSALKTTRRSQSSPTIQPCSLPNLNESVVSIGYGFSDDSVTEASSAESIPKDRSAQSVGIYAIMGDEALPTPLSPTQNRVSFAEAIEPCPSTDGKEFVSSSWAKPRNGGETPKGRGHQPPAASPPPHRRLLAFLTQTLASCKPKLKGHKASAATTVSN